VMPAKHTLTMGRLYAAAIVKAAARAPAINAPHAAGEGGAPAAVTAIRAARRCCSA